MGGTTLEAKEKKVMRVTVIVMLIAILTIFIGSIFEGKGIQSNSGNTVGISEEEIAGIMGSNGVLENENPSMLVAYSEWSYLEVLNSVFDSCTVDIREGNSKGEYIAKFIGNGRDNPFSGYTGQYTMEVEVNINTGECSYLRDSNTYVKYIIMAEN